MADDLNSVNLVGRLTSDPELRHSGAGNPICSMRVAFSSRVKTGDEWGDKSNYVDVTVFGRQAESAATYLAKGRRVGVNGRLDFQEWEKDGQRRSKIVVIANGIYFLDSRQEGDAAAAGGGGMPTSEPVSAGASSGGGEIPF